MRIQENNEITPEHLWLKNLGQLDLFEDGERWIYNHQTFPQKVEAATPEELRQMKQWEVDLIGFLYESGLHNRAIEAEKRLASVERRLE